MVNLNCIFYLDRSQKDNITILFDKEYIASVKDNHELLVVLKIRQDRGYPA